jgi:hypothetical protein
MRLMVSLLVVGLGAAVTAPPDWTAGVRISPVLGDAQRHSIHAYFNTSPESPDGRHVLLYTSTTADGHEGEVWLVERATGKTTVLAKNVVVEDAHRAACQQWLSGGRRVAFHDRRDGRWVVVCVDTDTLKERVLVEGRQVGWGQPGADVAPVYGPHWNPGKHRDLELIDVRTGEVRKVLTADAVRAAYPQWIAKRFGDRPISIFFPILSPDLTRVVFKVATPAGGDFRSKEASERDGLVCYDLKAGRFLWMHERWGHPAWHPDAQGLINYDGKGLYRIDARTGEVRRPSGLPAFPGSHPSFGPDGVLFATDFQPAKAEVGLWAVAVGSLDRGEHAVVHRFDNGRGSTSWRRSHPHPSFSPDGRRLYFNVSADRWTRLYVAECGGNN